MGRNNSISEQILADDTIANDERFKNTVYLQKKTYAMLEEIAVLSDSKNRNSAIEAAVRFYYGYLTGDISQDYLCGTVGTKMEAALRRSDDHQSRLLYKMSVQMNMLTRLLAKEKHVSKEEYDNSRRRAIQDVNATKGIIDLYDAGLD